MDPTFQSLLLNNNSANRNRNNNNNASSTQRPSRYAQLIPREALRLPSSSSSSLSQQKQQQQQQHSTTSTTSQHRHKKKKGGDNNNNNDKLLGDSSSTGKNNNATNDDTITTNAEIQNTNASKGNSSNNNNNTSNNKKKKKKKRAINKTSGNQGGTTTDTDNATIGGNNTTNGGVTSDDSDGSSSDMEDSIHGSDEEKRQQRQQRQEEEETINVYRMDSTTGQLELLKPEEDYDLVFYDDDDDNFDDGDDFDDGAGGNDGDGDGTNTEKGSGGDDGEGGRMKESTVKGSSSSNNDNNNNNNEGIMTDEIMEIAAELSGSKTETTAAAAITSTTAVPAVPATTGEKAEDTTTTTATITTTIKQQDGNNSDTAAPAEKEDATNNNKVAPMDVDDDDDQKKEDKDTTLQPPSCCANDDDIDNVGQINNQEDIIYIVRGPPPSSTTASMSNRSRSGSMSKKESGSRRRGRRANNGTAAFSGGTTSEDDNDSSSSSSLNDDDDDDEDDNALTPTSQQLRLHHNNIIPQGEDLPLPIDPLARDATRTASTLVRALVQRTEGFKNARPQYGLEVDSEDEEEEEEGKKKRKKEKEKKEKEKNMMEGKYGNNKKGSSSSSTAAKTGKDGKDTSATSSKKKDGNSHKGTANNDNTTDDDNNNDDDDDNNDDLILNKLHHQQHKGHKLLQTLSATSNVLDGDDTNTLMQLAKMRIWQENHLQPSMHGMELDDWEDGIDWEGGVDSDEEKNAKSENAKRATDNAKNDALNMDVVSAKHMDGKEENKDTADCTEDYRVDDYRPPVPEGGFPKRLRTLPNYSDPCQLLFEPRNPRLDALDLCAAVDWEGGVSGDDYDDDDDDSFSNFPLILQSSIAGQSVATLLAPCPSSRPIPFELHPNYQQRAESESASEITSTAKLTSGLNSLQERKELEKLKERQQKKREQMAKDKQNRVMGAMNTMGMGGGTGRRITSSLMGPGGAERTGRPSRHAIGSTSAHDAEYVEQLELVYNHTLVKPDLTLSEYRQYHRPRLPLIVVSPSTPWQFQTRVITTGKKGKRGAVSSTAADGSTVVGSYHAMISAGAKAQNKIRNEADLSPTMGDLVLLEYSEERPPVLMTKGMTCRIVNYYRGDRTRCPVSAGGGDRPLRKRHGDKAASAKGPEPAGPSGRMERPPRLIGPNQYIIKSAADLIGIIGSAKKKKSKEAAALEAKKAKETAFDILPEGVTEILHPKAVHGPFIGEVKDGKTQTGLISNLFAAPMFKHDSASTDFFMVLGQINPSSRTSSESRNELGVVLRPLPANIFCVGQTEPRVKVFSPNTNDEKKFVNAFIPYQVAKNLERTEMASGRGLTFEDIKDRLFANTDIPPSQLRMKIKAVANFERTNNGIWTLKAIGEDDFPGVESLGRRVSPEGVAAYESQCAAIRRLRDMGITELYSGGTNITNVATIMLYLNGAAHCSAERRLKCKKVLELKKRQKSPQVPYFQKAFDKLDVAYKEVKKRQEIAKFIYEELQLSPWHLSGEFIDVHKGAQGSAMMKLTGIGDPSGLGEAYNFLREMDNKPNKAAATNALNAQIQKITGTQNDLRKLTMNQMASLLRSYDMKDKEIAGLKRWDRVHVIRDLSTKAASDGMGDNEMGKFARGEKTRLSDQRKVYKERVQEIWIRQIAALSLADPGNDVSRADSEILPAMDSNEVDVGSDAGGEKGAESDDDDDDDDDFANELMMDMTSSGEANRLVAQLNENADPSMRTIGSVEGLSKDARELAAFKRQREEERALQHGFGKKGSALGLEENKRKKSKCIRRKVTKTHPDGTQIVTFEFIVQRNKVEEIMENLKKKSTHPNKVQRNKKSRDDADAYEDTCIGHAMFEDDDSTTANRRSVKVKIRKETMVINSKSSIAKKASHSKLISGSKHLIQAQEKKKKKRSRACEEEDFYKSHHRGKGTSNRKERGAARDRMPHVILSDRLEGIRSSVEGRPFVNAFLKPVSRRDYPHYYEVISEPIDLQTIREKNKKYEYKRAASFVRDFELMKKNAVKFNGKESPLAKEAIEIYDFVKSIIEQNKPEFDQMEEAVIDQMNNGRKKKKGSKASKNSLSAKSSSSTSKTATMNTANVVVDGIETQVNLGSNFAFGLGGDSDSDDS